MRTLNSDAEEVKLIVTDQQAQTLGYFLVNGLPGFVECKLQGRSCSERPTVIIFKDTTSDVHRKFSTSMMSPLHSF